MLRQSTASSAAGDSDAPSDAELVERFGTLGDCDAFAMLVRRHGAMVLGVCRRVLRDGHDAEDAFQASFLVLFRRAHSIRNGAKVANWLYGVAYRTSLRAKSRRHVLRNRESQMDQFPEPQANVSEQWKDFEPILDAELASLPEKYRLPIVLCELEGKSTREAAAELGWPEGTVSGRLSRGRVILRKRIARYGVVLTAGSLTAAFAQQASAAVPAKLVITTIQGARLLASGQAGLAEAYSGKVTALMKGVLKSMFLGKLKIAGAAVVALGIVGVGTVVVSHSPGGTATPGAVLVADVGQAGDGSGTAVATPKAADEQNAASEQTAKINAEAQASPEQIQRIISVMKAAKEEQRLKAVKALMENSATPLTQEQAEKQIAEEEAANAKAEKENAQVQLSLKQTADKAAAENGGVSEQK